MNTDKQRIYNGDWKTLHPYSGSAPTDLYYITLANKVLAAIRAVETSLDESDYRKIDETEQKELACILTAYFEDIISQTGIFQAFTRIHGKRFGNRSRFTHSTKTIRPAKSTSKKYNSSCGITTCNSTTSTYPIHPHSIHSPR